MRPYERSLEPVVEATLDRPQQAARPAARLDRVAAVSESTSDGSDGARRIATEARDRVRFEEEALALADQVYRVARHLAGSREDADDLVQDTYARAFRSWRQYTPGTNLRAWLLRILTNLNIDRGRRQQRTPDTQPLEEGDYYLYNRLEQTMPDGQAGEERVLERLSQNDVVGALADVPHDFRDVIVLVDIGDFSYADAAQILDIPIGTVMSRLHRGRRILKQGMADKVGER
jgi:RNA polymerase sigma-70 factor (ECF subfamily)